MLRWFRLLACAVGLGLFGVLPVVPALAAGPAQKAFTPWWVESFASTHLWSAQSDPAADYGAIPAWTFLLVVAPQTGPRLSVYVPWTKNYAYVDSRSVGPSGPPSAEWLAAVNGTPPPTLNQPAWVGRAAAGGLIERQAPTGSSVVLQTLPAGSVVQVVAWVVGDEQAASNWTWARLADGGYAYSLSLQVVLPTAPPPPPANHPAGRWIDVDLLQQTAVAYQDATPVYLASVSTGSPGWETPVGVHVIQRRVAAETMNGATLSHMGLDAWQASRIGYKISNVLDTQYFDGQGDALHENYWLATTQFGIPHSHGCVGMKSSDAQWFWNWANSGVPVVVRAS